MIAFGKRKKYMRKRRVRYGFFGIKVKVFGRIKRTWNYNKDNLFPNGPKQTQTGLILNHIFCSVHSLGSNLAEQRPTDLGKETI